MPVPTITLQNITTQLAKLRALGVEINNWNKDTVAAKKAKESLTKFLELSTAINDYIATELPKANQKKAGIFAGHRETLRQIKETSPTKGLLKQIDTKIKTDQDKQEKLEAARTKVTSQNENAIAVIKKLLPAIAETVEAYEAARLENKVGVLAQFKKEQMEIQTQIDLLTENKGQYVTQLSQLAQRVNKPTIVLNTEEEQLKKIILETAKKAEKAVDAMSINEQILALAPPKVQDVVLKLMSTIKTGDLVNLLAGPEAGVGSSLVAYAQGQLIKIAGKDSLIVKELAVISALSQESQLEIVTALITGKDSTGVLARNNVSQGTQLALTALLINQLATTRLDTNEKNAVLEFSRGLVSSMARVERGEATHLSVLAVVQGTVVQFHVDLQALRVNPSDFAALMAFNLAKIGVNKETEVVIAFTNPAQVGALSQLQGREFKSLQLDGGGLSKITDRLLTNTSSALKQITGGEIDVSDTSLVASVKDNKLVVNPGLNLHHQPVVDASNIVFDVIRALAIMNLTIQATVINALSQQKLGIDKLIGATPILMLQSPGRLQLEGPGLVAVAASDKKDNVPQSNPVQIPTVEITPKITEPVVINEKIVADFTSAMSKLKSLHTALKKKYGSNEKKNYIVDANLHVLISLNNALTQYKKDGNLDKFTDACNSQYGAINKNVRELYNTDRDSKFTQFFTAIAHAFKSFFKNLFASSEAKQSQANFVTLFGDKRPTSSARVLDAFIKDMDKAFKVIDVADDELDLGKDNEVRMQK